MSGVAGEPSHNVMQPSRFSCLAGIRGKVWIAVALLLLSGGALAQPGPDAAVRLRDYTHDSWNSRDGLPHNTILGITQSREGYLWLATWEGLVRYNGNEFRTFDRSSQPALRDSAISAMHAGRDGGLWFADSRGNLGRWLPGDTMRFWGRAEGLPGNGIDSLYEDDRGQVWIALNGAGLGRLQPATGRFDLLKPAEHGAGFVGIRPVQDEAGRMWVGSLQGLMYVEGDRLLLADLGLRPGVAWPYRAPDGRMWVVAGDSLYFMQGGKLRHWRSVPQAGRITAMLEDRHGVVWLGTENRGVLRLEQDGRDEVVDRAMELPEGRVAALFEDREGSIWMGANGGLYRLREALFTNVNMRSGLGNDFVRTLAEDTHGAVWIGGSGGLDVLPAGGEIRHVSLPSLHADQGDASVLALLVDGDEMWAGTYGDGLYRLRDGRVLHRYDAAEGLPSSHVRTLARSVDGSLWIGTRQGVSQLRGGTIQPLQTQGMPRTLVHALLETEGVLWIGASSGLYRYAGGKAERIALGNAEEGARQVLALYLDVAEKALWASTDRGLYRLRGGEVAHVGLEQGLPVDAVFQMVVDSRGSAWLGSNRGVLRMDHARLNAVADGHEATLAVDLYGSRDGMASSQGNGGSGTSTLLANDGSVWFATGEGAAVVRPARLQRFRTQSSPAVVIEKVMADGQPLAFTGPGVVVVPANTRRLAVTYAGLSYLSPHGIRYGTRLEGFDRGRVSRGNQRVVEFTSLSPGDYTLHIDAANGENAGDGQEAVLRLHIEPYWWQRTSVRIVGFLALLLLGIGLYWRRSVQYRRDAARLERLVEQRTDDLQRQTERLAEAAEEKQGLLDRLGVQAQLLAQQAHQDSLTGLPNRRAFEERIGVALQRVRDGKEVLSLAMMDIDHFKRINDQRSHAVGDEVLRRFAEVVGQACRADDFLARIGGEEFVLLLPGLGQEKALLACERVRAAVEQSDLGEVAQGLPVTTSIGVMQATAEMSPDALMQAADAALYRAKHGGRNRVEGAEPA